jgi:autoinducer 2-degrading protein
VTYVIAATYVANDGEADGVAGALKSMTPLTRQEPGCRSYQAHQSLEDPNTFFIFEVYDDEHAFQAHAAADYFETYIPGKAWPRLANRDVVRAQPLGDE